MSGSIQAKVITAFALSLVILGSVAGLAYYTTNRLIEDNREVVATYEILIAMETLYSSILDAESNLRGFLLTEERSHLEIFEIAAALNGSLDQLRELTDADPAQQSRVEQLEHWIQRKLEFMNETLELTEAEADKPLAEVTRQFLGSGYGKHQMDEIRGLITKMAEHERALLTQRTNRSESSVQAMLVAVTCLLLLSLAMMGVNFLIIRRDLIQRRQVEAELSQSRERFVLAVQGSRDGLWDWDIRTNEVYFSPQWKAMLGYEDHEIKNRYDEWEARVHPNDRDRALATIQAYHIGTIADYELEHRLQHKDGSYRWILARGVTVRDEQGRPYRMAGSHTDITARKEAERKLAEKNQELEEAMSSEHEAHEALKQAQVRMIQSEKLASLGQLVAGVAHEINNPLAYVMNNVAVLQRDVAELSQLIALYEQANEMIACHQPDLREGIQTQCDRIDLDYTLRSLQELMIRSRDGLRRIQQIVVDLRDFARLDENDLLEVDLNTGMESTVHIVQGRAESQEITLDLDLQPLPRVLCYPGKINQVVLNLLNNALDVTPRGGRVSIRSRATSDQVEIHVLDTGPGIDPVIQEKIFDPFFTTKPLGKGTGLGLSLSYGIIREHGGKIEFESEPGKGAHFVVRLPSRPFLSDRNSDLDRKRSTAQSLVSRTALE